MSITVMYSEHSYISTFLYGNLGLAFDAVKVSQHGFIDLRNNDLWLCTIIDEKESSEFLEQLDKSGSPIKPIYEELEDAL